MMGTMDADNTHAQSKDTGHENLQQSHMSSPGVMGERLLTEESAERSLFNVRYWDGLSAYRMLNTVEEEPGVSEVVEITYDRDDKQPPITESSENIIANETGINQG